eukprot:5146171-Prymnesium_polylepis.1
MQLQTGWRGTAHDRRCFPSGQILCTASRCTRRREALASGFALPLDERMVRVRSLTRSCVRHRVKGRCAAAVQRRPTAPRPTRPPPAAPSHPRAACAPRRHSAARRTKAHPA